MWQKIKKTKENIKKGKEFQKLLCPACKRRMLAEIKKGNIQGTMDGQFMCDKCREKVAEKVLDEGKENLEGMVND